MERKAWPRYLALAATIASLGSGTAAAIDLVNNEPTATKLSLDADFTGAAFGNSNSWWGKSTEFLGKNTDSWQEFGFKPLLAFETQLGRGTLSARLSGVYTRTWDYDASGLGIGKDKQYAFTLEEANIGWKVTDLFAKKDTLSITVGRLDYTIGTGLIIADGTSDGGERGGWYIGMRKAFAKSVLLQWSTDKWLVEGFHLENRPRRDNGVEGSVSGGNIEYTFPDVKLGGTYMKADPNLPNTQSLNVYSGRLDWGGERKLHIRGEYVKEKSDQTNAAGWYTEILYNAAMPWSPTFSYRYAHFDGDDPRTSVSERFQEIAYGSTDYGSWYQGEIAGNYPLGNANVVSHMLRAKLKPRENITMNVIGYRFMLDQPASLGSGVTDDHFGDEIDVTCDWQATKKLLLIGVVGTLIPGKAATEWTGGNKTWLYSMFYITYSW